MGMFDSVLAQYADPQAVVPDASAQAAAPDATAAVPDSTADAPAAPSSGGMFDSILSQYAAAPDSTADAASAAADPSSATDPAATPAVAPDPSDVQMPATVDTSAVSIPANSGASMGVRMLLGSMDGADRMPDRVKLLQTSYPQDTVQVGTNGNIVMTNPDGTVWNPDGKGWSSIPGYIAGAIPGIAKGISAGAFGLLGAGLGSAAGPLGTAAGGAAGAALGYDGADEAMQGLGRVMGAPDSRTLGQHASDDATNAVVNGGLQVAMPLVGQVASDGLNKFASRYVSPAGQALWDTMGRFDGATGANTQDMASLAQLGPDWVKSYLGTGSGDAVMRGPTREANARLADQVSTGLQNSANGVLAGPDGSMLAAAAAPASPEAAMETMTAGANAARAGYRADMYATYNKLPLTTMGDFTAPDTFAKAAIDQPLPGASQYSTLMDPLLDTPGATAWNGQVDLHAADLAARVQNGQMPQDAAEAAYKSQFPFYTGEGGIPQALSRANYQGGLYGTPQMSVDDLINARRAAFLKGATPAQAQIRGAWRGALDDNMNQILSPEDQALFAQGNHKAGAFLAQPSMADPVGGQGYAADAVDSAVSSGNPDGYLRARLGGGANATTALAQGNALLDPDAQRNMASYYANAMGQGGKGAFDTNTFLNRMGRASAPYQSAIGGALDGGSGAFGTTLSTAPAINAAIKAATGMQNPSGTAAAMQGSEMTKSAIHGLMSLPAAVAHPAAGLPVLGSALNAFARHGWAKFYNSNKLAQRAFTDVPSDWMQNFSQAGQGAFGGVSSGNAGQALGAFGNYYAPDAKGAFTSLGRLGAADYLSQD